MEDNKEAKLLQARQLLKKYQTKHPQNGEMSQMNHLNGNETYSDAASIPSSRASSVCEISKPNNNFNLTNNEKQELIYLKRALEDKDKTYADVVQKFQTLQTHYAELHTAYNLANQTLQNSTSKEFAEQITKLQTALSVAIEEKTSYQSELRTFKNKLASLEAENKALHDQIRSTNGSSNLYETEKRKLHEEVDRLARQLKSVTSDLEKQRQESLKLESKIRQVNQDRNDTQARLKYIFNEKEDLEKAVASMKHEIQMKEIFIKQLTFNDSEEKNLNSKDHQEAYINLNMENQKLLGEVGMLQTKLDELQRQQLGTREYYESCIGELNQKVAYLEAKLNNVEREKVELETNNYQIQEKINFILNQQAASATATAAASQQQQNLVAANMEDAKQKSHSSTNLTSSRSMTAIVNNIDMVEFDALKNSLFAIQSDYSRAVDRIHEMEAIIDEKETIIEEIEKQNANEKAKLMNLQNDIATQQTVQTDVHLLLEQLQNEKATVSRAIAQNIELKEQLGELQDKFVEVTNQSALHEDQRLTALATIEKLQKQMDEIIEGKNLQQNYLLPKKVEQGIQTTEEIFLEKGETKNYANVENHRINSSPESDQEKTFAPNERRCSSELEFAKEAAATEINDETQENSKVVFSPQLSPTFSSSSSSSSGGASISRDEIIKTLENRLEILSKEKNEIKIANDKLQYFLTALESENESIGEYIALYQFQRSNIQKKAAEKDALISQLSYEKKAAQTQIAELQQILYNIFGQSPPVLSVSATTTKNNENLLNGKNPPNEAGASSQPPPNNNEALDKLNKILFELQHRQHSSSSNHFMEIPNGTSTPEAYSASSTTFSDPKLHCPECRGQMFTL